jgi:hypothetical protein
VNNRGPTQRQLRQGHSQHYKKKIRIAQRVPVVVALWVGCGELGGFTSYLPITGCFLIFPWFSSDASNVLIRSHFEDKAH